MNLADNVLALNFVFVKQLFCNLFPFFVKLPSFLPLPHGAPTLTVCISSQKNNIV